jgi:hypothetical protein
MEHLLLNPTPMPRLSVWGPLVLMALCGCDHDDAPEPRTAHHARRFAIDDCIANIQVYPPGAPLPQPYAVLAPLDAGFVGNWGWSSTSRFKRMKKRACELGADAIIDAADPNTDNRVTTTYQYDAAGRPISVVQQASQGDPRRMTALAIQFAGPQAAAPPQVVVGPEGASRQVVVAPQVVVQQVVVPQAVSAPVVVSPPVTVR